MILVLVLVLATIATVRGTRYIVHDYLNEPVRRWIIRRFGEESKISYLFYCEACASIWVAAFTATLANVVLGSQAGWVTPGWLWLSWPLQVLAYSEITIRMINTEK